MIKQSIKDTFFSKNHSLNCRGKLVSLHEPKVMGILNVTPDSFHDGGKYMNPGEALKKVREMVEDGVDIVDIGAVSTRPGATFIDFEEELRRLEPVVAEIRNEYPELILSIDTYNSKVAERMITDYEADMINDISAGFLDDQMFNVIARLNVPYIIMHMKGTPGNMQDNPEYQNIADEIIQYFSERLNRLTKLGITDVLLDPGFGFGKTLDHNYELLSFFQSLKIFELPLVAGVSRKSMIYKLLETSSENALNGTTATHIILLQKGANILRVHDVKEAKEAITIFMETEKHA